MNSVQFIQFTNDYRDYTEQFKNDKGFNNKYELLGIKSRIYVSQLLFIIEFKKRETKRTCNS